MQDKNLIFRQGTELSLSSSRRLEEIQWSMADHVENIIGKIMLDLLFWHVLEQKKSRVLRFSLSLKP